MSKTARAGTEDYVLGTREDEIARLGMQHEAWRPTVLDCWRRAGIGQGMRVLDVGAGPGYASFELAGLVGPRGVVLGVERSTRFVEFARSRSAELGLDNVHFEALDLMRDAVPESGFDAAWCRWVGSFVESPLRLARSIANAVRPGGIVILHEYVDYASWRYSPPLPIAEAHIRRVMQSWRSAGGEPDVAMQLTEIIVASGFRIREAVPRVFCARPGDPMWAWIDTFLRVNSKRMVELGECEREWVAALHDEIDGARANPDALMLTPMVLEIVAERVGDPAPAEER